MRWDLFCRVVDNYGDIGFCWRLTRQLVAEYGQSVRLWVDDLARLKSLCPEISPDREQQFVGQIEVCHWTPGVHVSDLSDVVIEAFACELPEWYVEAMIHSDQQPIWINLEYLSAESWVEDCHLSPSSRLRTSLKKTFFFPGFTAKTGGLLRERTLLEERSRFDDVERSRSWTALDLQELSDDDDSLIVSLFCYENGALPELLDCWTGSPRSIRVLATPGFAREQIVNWSGRPLTDGESLRRNSLTVHGLPFLSQDNYDRLLWSCDLNFVRGEDSFVRAQWAQRPFVWQIYPQSERAHFAKLDAFLSRYLVALKSSEAVRRFWAAWNGDGKVSESWQDFAATLPQIEQHGKVWAMELDQAGNLADNLVRFVCRE